MQVFGLLGNFNRLSQYGNVELSIKEPDRLRALALWQETGDVRLACWTFGLSRETWSSSTPWIFDPFPESSSGNSRPAMWSLAGMCCKPTIGPQPHSLPCSWKVEELNQELLQWEKIYNTIRPHQALGYLAPLQFLKQQGIIPNKNPSSSHIC